MWYSFLLVSLANLATGFTPAPVPPESVCACIPVAIPTSILTVPFTETSTLQMVATFTVVFVESTVTVTVASVPYTPSTSLYTQTVSCLPSAGTQSSFTLPTALQRKRNLENRNYAVKPKTSTSSTKATSTLSVKPIISSSTTRLPGSSSTRSTSITSSGKGSSTSSVNPIISSSTTRSSKSPSTKSTTITSKSTSTTSRRSSTSSTSFSSSTSTIKPTSSGQSTSKPPSESSSSTGFETFPPRTACSDLVPSGYTAAISSACSSLGLLPQPTTRTVVQSETTTIVGPVGEVSTITSVGSTKTVTVTSATIGTSTGLFVTAPATVTTTVNGATIIPTGINFHYASNVNYGDTISATAAAVNSLRNNTSAFTFSNTIINLDFGPELQFVGDRSEMLFRKTGTRLPTNNYAIIQQGYFYANSSFPRVINIDTFFLFSSNSFSVVWTGNKSLANNWTWENRDDAMFFYGIKPPGDGIRQDRPVGNRTYIIPPHEALPFTILWGQNSGSAIPEYSYYLSGAQLIGDCGGNFIP
ncbi:hypothetical protein JX266_010632 [Neoarthrinium moseri]|nr:hypothetical protein JX266_010632 [Neoarthrinium moseri]